MKLDEIDKKLINLLQEDCTQPIKDLSKKVNLSVAPIHERLKRIEKSGIIKKYVAIVDFGLVNKPLISFCSVSIFKHNTEKFLEFEKAINAIDEIMECYITSGNYDYILKVITSDMEEYQNFVINKLGRLDIIANINSQFVLKPVKSKTSIRLK